MAHKVTMLTEAIFFGLRGTYISIVGANSLTCTQSVEPLPSYEFRWTKKYLIRKELPSQYEGAF